MNDAALKTVPPPRNKPKESHGMSKAVMGLWVGTTFIVGCLAGAVVFWYGQSRTELGNVRRVANDTNIKMVQVLSGLDSLQHSVNHNVEEELIFFKILYLHEGAPPIRFKQARKIAEAVRRGALKFKRDPDFVLSIIAAESNFNADAVSKAGALGLMQVMPQWHDILRLEGDLLDVSTNIRHGLLVYGFYENMYKDTELTLTAYNRGPGMVDTDLMKGKDPNRNGYARAVLKVYRRLKRLSQKE